MSILRFKNVWETFRVKFVINNKPSWDNIWALRDINFELEKGEALGIIGENGAGKTTLLKLAAGILKPDRGEISAEGRVAGLLELGAGFQPELTGRENVYLSGSMFGLNKSKIDELYQDIINFASLDKFINAQVKCYSQGMFVRLAFAIAVHMNPDVLLIDDTLAVGDEFFQKKCIKKIFEIKERGTTLIFVTHDMNMLRRLCKRVVFLKEGRIIRDGPIDKVAPLYTQMIGNKNEVGVLEAFPASVVFNSGKIFINWRDKLITPSSGLYTSFHILDKWYSSLQADWEVEKYNNNSLVARGKMYQLELTQVWKIKLTDSYEIELSIEMESALPFDIQEGYVNVMLTSEYTHWCTALEKKEFPPIVEADKEWIPLIGGDAIKEGIGVEKRETAENALPSLVFYYLNSPFSCHGQILNSDYFLNCRILQYRVSSLQNYSDNHERAFLYFSGKVVLGDFSAKDYLRKLYDNFMIVNNKLKLIFSNGRCALLSNDSFLTKAGHIFAMFRANGQWYSSSRANWEVKKEKDGLLIARGKWHNLPVTQIWEVKIKDTDSFSLKVYLKVEEAVNITRQYLRLECSQEYEYYYSCYGKGKFPEEFLSYEIDILQRCIPDGDVVFQNNNGGIVPLLVRFSKNSGSFAKVFNSDISTRARILKIERSEPEDNTQFLPDEYLCFDTEICLAQPKVINEGMINPVKVLQKNKLKFVFDNGRGRIYWDGRELTKGLGVYTSLRVLGRWYDSYSRAVWEGGDNNGIIKCVGKWLYLPLTQFWQVTLEKDNTIMLEISVSVDKDIELDRLQTNIMLTERYKEWFAGKDKGFFPSFKGDIDDDWEVIASNANDTTDVDFVGVSNNGIEGQSLPALKFLSYPINSEYKLNIVNSDLYYRGRVLQCLKKGRIVLAKGEYQYFKGRISIQGL